MSTVHSATLAIDEAVAEQRAQGRTVLHLGFGEAGLPVPPGLASVLADAAQHNRYGPVDGAQQARSAAAGWFTRRGLPTTNDQIIFGPGSKPLLFAIMSAIPGDVVLPQPAWVSYAAQAALLDRRVIPVPIPAQFGGIPDPDLLEQALIDARSQGHKPGVLVLTVPDNPTGTVASAAALQAVCAIAEAQNLVIVCDEIYAELVHHGSAPSAATYLPHRTVITTGLSKSLALGGWRIGFTRTPDNSWGHDLHQAITGIASEVWSCLAAPMQAVAAHALSDPPEITTHIDASRNLHAQIAAAVHSDLIGAGAICRPPQGGFYLYPDFEAHRHALAARGITTNTQLATTLLNDHGIATLPGAAFGDDNALTLRIATSLLYGTTTEQRLTALSSQNPDTLPWIADQLNHLRRGLANLLHT